MGRFIFVLVLTGFALHCSCLQAQILLDEVMSKEDQKKTGVDKLNKNQKIALEIWLDQNFTPKVKTQESENELFLSINIDNGHKIQLSDNTIWEVSPDDVNTSSFWLTPFAVKIIPSGDPKYPCLIVNKDSNVSVKARRIFAPRTVSPSS